jgi:hypothetical protein
MLGQGKYRQRIPPLKGKEKDILNKNPNIHQILCQAWDVISGTSTVLLKTKKLFTIKRNSVLPLLVKFSFYGKNWRI